MCIDVMGDLFFFNKKIVKSFYPKKILIVKIDQFGDVLFSTFLLPIIKEKYKGVEIDYLINEKTELILKNNPNIRKL